jgi:hypothetical protein
LLAVQGFLSKQLGLKCWCCVLTDDLPNIRRQQQRGAGKGRVQADYHCYETRCLVCRTDGEATGGYAIAQRKICPRPRGCHSRWCDPTPSLAAAVKSANFVPHVDTEFHYSDGTMASTTPYRTLREWEAAGTLTGETLVWMESWPDWAPVAECRATLFPEEVQAGSVLDNLQQLGEGTSVFSRLNTVVDGDEDLGKLQKQGLNLLSGVSLAYAVVLSPLQQACIYSAMYDRLNRAKRPLNR